MQKAVKNRLLHDFKSVEPELRKFADNNYQQYERPWVTFLKNEEKEILAKARFNRKVQRFDRIELSAPGVLEEIKIPHRPFAAN